MKRFDFAIAPKELAEAMMADLGNGPTTVNGDRSSTYFLVAKAEKEQNGEITAALIENKAGLEPDEQFWFRRTALRQMDSLKPLREYMQG